MTTIDSAYELEGNLYEVNTYRDGPGGLSTKGFEVTGRTAFTFLPSFLRFTGGGFNFSSAKSNEANTRIDLITGIALPPRGESSYYYNLNLWYDDGRLNARVAYQARDFYYDRMAPEGANRVPAFESSFPGGGAGPVTSYYKLANPIFRDETETLDARAQYKINERFSLFAEGKNLLDDSSSRYSPEEYRRINDQGTPFIFDSVFIGRKYYVGLIATF